MKDVTCLLRADHKDPRICEKLCRHTPSQRHHVGRVTFRRREVDPLRVRTGPEGEERGDSVAQERWGKQTIRYHHGCFCVRMSIIHGESGMNEIHRFSHPLFFPSCFSFPLVPLSLFLYLYLSLRVFVSVRVKSSEKVSSRAVKPPRLHAYNSNTCPSICDEECLGLHGPSTVCPM